MPAALALYADAEFTIPVNDLALGETVIEEDMGIGHSTPIWARNEGTTVLRDIEITVDETHVQLAVDDGGKPGVWAAPGAGISIDELLFPGSNLKFWSRAVYEFSDREGDYDFHIEIRAMSVA